MIANENIQDKALENFKANQTEAQESTESEE